MNLPLDTEWDPYEWQDFALQLVRERHSAERCQRVPDRDRGDLGIEVFTTDGCLYQCYAPDGDASVEQRRDRHRAKLSKDIGKLIRNASRIQKVLGGLIAGRWILLVPLFDSKEVLVTAETERRRVVEAQVPFIAQDFRVLVWDQSDFSGEIESLRRRSAQRVRLPLGQTTDGQLTAWWDSHDDLAATLLSKIGNAWSQHTEDQVREQAKEFIGFYLRFGNLTELLRETAPDVWESLQATIASAERQLIAIGHGGDRLSEGLRSQLERIKGSVGRDLPGYHESNLDTLAMGVLADWLMRCPLR